MNDELNRTIVAAMCISLNSMSLDELAALNYGESWDSPRLQKENMAFEKAVELGLIREDGSYLCREELGEALTMVVNERLGKMPSELGAVEQP